MSMAAMAETKDYFERRFDTAQNTGGNYTAHLFEILDALGWNGDVRALRDALPQETKALGFTEFLNVMSYLGYAPKIIQTSKNKINDEMMPCLFIAQDDKDKRKGEVILTQTKGNAAGTAYIFREDTVSGDVIPDKTIAGSGLKWFSKLLLRFKGVFGQVLMASLVINLLALVAPLFMMSVYDKVIGAHSAPTLKYFLAGIVLALGVEFSLRFLRAKSLSWFGARIDYIVSNAIFERVLALPASFTERASVTAQLARLKAFESVREFFTGPLFLSFVELPFMLILWAAIGVIAGPLAVIPLLISAAYALLLLCMRPILKAATARMASASGERQSMNIETLNKQHSLRYAGGFDAWLERYEKTSAEASYASYRYNRAVSFIDTVSQGLVTIGGIAMIYFGVERIWADQMSMGALIAVLILTWRMLAPLQMACTALPRLDQVRRNIDQINRLMALEPERKSYRVSHGAPQFNGEIEFYNVGLRYTKEADVVYAGLSFKAAPGQLVAVVGSNSTGKSTTLKLVSGLYHPQAGSIRIDGTDIRQIDPLKLRQNIAYVGQEPEFFSGTLGENLRLVKPDAADEELKAALERAGLKEWFGKLPQGLETPMQQNIPSSIRPNLALARAYVQNAAIMLIDEMPYEFLNSEAGGLFFEYLQSQKGKRTILYITYRQDYIDLADIVVQLQQDGRPQVKYK